MLSVFLAVFLGASAALAAEVTTDSLANEDLRRSRGIPWVLPPGDDAWLQPIRVTPSPRPSGSPEDEFAAIDALFAEPDRPDDANATAPLDAATAPVSDVPMRPNHMVWADVSPELLIKRKIRDVVQLQALVGPDGRVADVRVLRGIPRCRECVESAVLAAKQYVYDAPDATTLPFGVWTMPFEIGFNYRP